MLPAIFYRKAMELKLSIDKEHFITHSKRVTE